MKKNSTNVSLYDKINFDTVNALGMGQGSGATYTTIWGAIKRF